MRLLCSATVLVVALAACDDLYETAERHNQGAPEGPPAELDAPVSEGGLRVLTQREYAHSIHDLFGADITIPRLSHDTAVSGWTTVGASISAIAPNASDDLETAALAIAKQVFVPTKRDKLVGCAPSGAASDTCVEKFVDTWGRRVFRRKLGKEEAEQYAALAAATGKDLGDPWGGMEMALGAMLQSPNFVYRLDATEVDPGEPTLARFTASSMASRLSYFLWSSTPDDALLDAADRGELATEDGLKREIDRMLGADKAQEGVLQFVDEWLDTSSIDSVEKDAKLFPQLTPALRSEMREQVERTVKDLVWDRGASYLDLFDTREIFMSPALAPLYGVPAPQAPGFTKITLDASQGRSGLLGWAGILTLKSRSYASSPTLRGLFVRERLLCQTVPPPPPNASQMQPQAVDGKVLTTRQLAEARLANTNCKGCHARMDGIGLGLENFDAIGRYRTMDGVAAIDASGQLDGVAFNGPSDLAKAVRDHRDVPTCSTKNLLRYASGRMESGDDEPKVQELVAVFASKDHQMKSMFAALAASDSFRRPKIAPQGGK